MWAPFSVWGVAMNYVEYRKQLLANMSGVRVIEAVSFFAVFSAWLAHYYSERAIREVQYDQDYAINNGVVYG